MVTGATADWASILSAGRAFGDWWWTWQRAIGVVGQLLAADGFAIAAYVRRPAARDRATSEGISPIRT